VNAALRAEIEAWLASPADNSQPAPFVNVRAAGFTSMRDAEQWARANAVPTVKINGRLFARRGDAEAAQANPARERVYYTTSVTGATEYESRDAAAEAVRLAKGWTTIALSHVAEMPFVTAYETEEESCGAEKETAPRVVRHTQVERRS
jgi:hypothetical protein